MAKYGFTKSETKRNIRDLDKMVTRLNEMLKGDKLEKEYSRGTVIEIKNIRNELQRNVNIMMDCYKFRYGEPLA